MNAPLAFSMQDAVVARSSVGLAGLPTIVALGPFDDAAHAEQLAAAFTTVRRRCRAQLVLLGTGAQRTTVMRQTFAGGIRTSLHVVRDPSQHPWSDLIAAADVVVPSIASGASTLLQVMATGRPVVAPVSPTTMRLVVPATAGLVYRPGDVSAMAGALLRLLTTPALRHGMACRAREVARRHHDRPNSRQPIERNEHA